MAANSIFAGKLIGPSGGSTSGGVAYFSGTSGTILTSKSTFVFDGTHLGVGTGSPTSVIHGVATLSAATGNEVAYTFAYTVNKLTSGNDTGLLISMTDTASPGTSKPLDVQVGGSSKFSVDNGGSVALSGGLTVSGGSVLIPSSGAFGWNGSTNIFADAAAVIRIVNSNGTAGARLDFTTDATLKLRNRANSADAALTAGAGTFSALGAFAAGDKYVIADASGNLHISATGPAS